MKVPEPKQLPSGTWFIQLRLGGESISVTAPDTKTGKADCRHKAELIKAEYRAGKRQIQKNKANPTLKQAIDDYIDSKSNVLSPSTIRGYQNIRDERFKSVMNKPIKSVKDWQKVVNSEAELCSAKTLKNAWRFCASAIRKATGESIEVQLPQVVPKEIIYLQPEQIPDFIRAVKGRECEISALLALSSLRRSEILALDWKNVDLKKERVLVSGAAVWGADGKLTQKDTNKSASSRRYVPIMMPELLSALNAVKTKEGKVVNIAPNTMRKQINRACEENGLPKVSVHGLRHSFASLAYHLGLSEKECMKLGGWSDNQTMSKIYTHLAEADAQNSENKMTEFYKNANNNANKDKRDSIINAYSVD